ncbi:MAG: O-methyltransferase [Bacilli bacterium]|nr:O-methyltransferase [Bacilli bacterium]
MDRLEKYAKKMNIPIMQKDGILFLIDYIKKNNVKSILEIGSAIGYSAINMAKVDSDIKVVTIERDEVRYKEAIKNIKDYGLEKQIKVIFGDALNIEIDDMFDLIFIDAAKAQYVNFFEKYKSNLKENGTIISDNLDFHGLTHENVVIKNKNLRSLVRKINDYKKFLQNNSEFHTEFLMIGDGIGVTKKV